MLSKEIKNPLHIHLSDIGNLVTSSFIEIGSSFEFVDDNYKKFSGVYLCLDRLPFRFADVLTGEIFTIVLTHQIPLCYV